MPRGVDVVLVNPGDPRQVYQSLGTGVSAVENPVWAGMIAGFVRARGYSVAIVDGNAHGLSPDETARQVHEMSPTLTALVVYGHQPSASTQNMPAASAVCSALKRRRPDGKVLLVGGHVAALPERTLLEEEADFVAGGEGLWTIVDLVECLAAGENDLGKVRDLWHRDGRRVATGPPAELTADLDTAVPEIPWDLLPMARYRAHNWHAFGQPSRVPYAAIYTTLGCPFKCTFCCIQAPFRAGERRSGIKSGVNSYRFWNPKKVVDEIGTLVERYGVRNLKIADEMFVLNPRHVREICDLIVDRKYDLNIWAYARVDSVRDDMLDRLKRAGVNWLAFGVESASERVRDDAHKSFAQDAVARVLGRVRAAGINVIANYIFGLPEDDLATMRETLDMALALNCEFANFYCAMAYPGSELYRIALREGWRLPDSWSGYSQHSVDTLPLPTKYVTAGEVLAVRDRAFDAYYANPAYHDMIRRRFGTATFAEIEALRSHRLVRRHAAEAAG